MSKKNPTKKSTVSIKSNQTRNSLIFLLVLAISIIIWWRITDLRYWQNYKKYPAQITKIYQVYRGKYKTMWCVKYQYVVNGKVYTNDDDFFNKSDYGDRQVGDTIIIEVSSYNADVSRWKP